MTEFQEFANPADRLDELGSCGASAHCYKR
jgi:hypothetical protein